MAVVDLQVYRGDSTDIDVSHDYAASEISRVRFYVREDVDGALLLALRSDTQADRFTSVDEQVTVHILPGDTDPIPAGRWRYDVELLLSDGTVKTVQYGRFTLIGDVSRDVATDTPPAFEYHVTEAERQALDAAESPGSSNPYMTRSATDTDIDGKVADHAAIADAHHDPVTLASGSSPLLSLSGQEISLDRTVEGVTVAVLQLPEESDDENPTVSVASVKIRPGLGAWQYTQGGNQHVSGALRMEMGTGALDSNGQAAITFQQVFAEVVLVMLQDYTAANAMYPSGIGTSGFTANGTPNDGFGWLVIGRD